MVPVHEEVKKGYFISLLLKYPSLVVFSSIATILSTGFETVGMGSITVFLSCLNDSEALFSNVPGGIYIARWFGGLTLEHRVVWVATSLAVAVILRGIFLFLSVFLTEIIHQNINHSLRTQTFNKTLGIDFQTFNLYQTGRLTSIVQGSTTQTAMGANSLLKAFHSLLTVAMYVGLMMVLSFGATSISISALFLIYISLKRPLNSAMKRLGERLYSTTVQLHSRLLESLNGMRIVRLFSKEQFCDERYKQSSARYRRDSLAHVAISAAISPVMYMIIATIVGLLMVVGVYVLKTDFGAHVPVIILLVMVMIRLSAPIQQFTQFVADYRKTLGFCQAQMEFMELEQAQEKKKTSFKGLKEMIRYENVSFSYRDASEATLSDITLTISKGGMTAIVGPSGGGKSTLINLLGRLIIPSEGKIFVDGQDLQDVEIKSWRDHISFVSQDSFLFNDTVANNLLFAKEDASQEELEEAAQLAHAHDFIIELEQGYDTIVGNNGVRLSGGQQQRISIARAILRKPDILVFDEATSHLDSFAEETIQEAIKTFKGKCTLVVIAHRLSTIRSADQIVVLKDGEITEQGTHDMLVTNNSLYKEMAALQFQQ